MRAEDIRQQAEEIADSYLVADDAIDGNEVAATAEAARQIIEGAVVDAAQTLIGLARRPGRNAQTQLQAAMAVLKIAGVTETVDLSGTVTLIINRPGGNDA
jgi:hypothetical protein